MTPYNQRKHGTFTIKPHQKRRPKAMLKKLRFSLLAAAAVAGPGAVARITAPVAV
jgi:hypothetical protein